MSSKEQLEALRVAQDSEASIAAAVERETHLKAHSNEIEVLKVAHADALRVAHDQIKDKAAAADNLNVTLTRLKEEKEEIVAKLSELEVEILELRESQELAEDQRAQLLARIKIAEEELLSTASAKQRAIEEVKAKEVDHAALVDNIKKDHHEALEAASEERTNVVVALEALKEELATSVAAQEQVEINAQAALEEHARKLEEMEEVYKSKQTELSDEIKRITSELEVTTWYYWNEQQISNVGRFIPSFQGQASYYNSKVDAIKLEHSQLLQDAFERAKVCFSVNLVDIALRLT